MVSPGYVRSLPGWFGRVSVPQHFHDLKSNTPLRIFAGRFLAFAVMCLLPMIRIWLKEAGHSAGGPNSRTKDANLRPLDEPKPLYRQLRL